MHESRLTEDEKILISSVARKAYDRNVAANMKQDKREEQVNSAAPFSLSALNVRITSLESLIKDVARRWSINLNQVLFVVERLESQNSVMAGELVAIKERLDKQGDLEADYRDDLKSAAATFAHDSAARIDESLQSVKALLSEMAGMQGGMSDCLAVDPKNVLKDPGHL